MSFEFLEKFRVSTGILISAIDNNICCQLSEYNINELFPLYTMHEINPKNYKFILVYKSMRSKSYKQVIDKLNICKYEYEVNKFNNKYVLMF